jgi:hypothetical protein
MIELLPKTQREIQESLHLIAEKHAARSDGFLELLPIDPEEYPGQAITNYMIKSDSVLEPNQADTFAAGVEPRYPDLIRAFDEYTDENSETFSRFYNIAQAVQAGENIVNGTDHAELVDIIFSHLHFVNRLRRSQEAKARELGDKPEKHALRSGLIVSKMIDFLGVNAYGTITPVRNLLELGFDRTYLTIPRTGNSESLFEKGAIKTYNRVVRSEISGDFRKRPFSNRHPMVLGVALPGTVNKQSLDDPEVSVIGRANEGILDFAKDALTVMTAIRMRNSGSNMYIDELMENLYSAQKLHSAVGRLTVAIGELDGKKYIYDEFGNTKTVEPKDFRIKD